MDRFSAARNAFRDAYDQAMVCRDDEAAQLDTFLGDCFKNDHGGHLYISGIAGTGKTSLVKQWLRQHPETIKPPHHLLFINVMVCKRAADVFQHIAEGLVKSGGLPSDTKLHKDCSNLLDAYFSNGMVRGALCCLILDEIDRLDSTTLYQLFRWPRVIVIGIANTLDLITRKLPRLADHGRAPQSLPMKPYTTAQIEAIIKAKWQTTEAAPLFLSNALEICARKVAAASGDLRKAIAICRHAIDSVQSAGQTHITTGTIMTAIVKMTGQDTPSMAADLTLHQKTLLICIVRMQNKMKLKEWTIREVFLLLSLSFFTTKCKILNQSPHHFLDSSSLYDYSQRHRPFTTIVHG